MIAKNRKLTAAMVAAGILSASTLVGAVNAGMNGPGPGVSNTGSGSAVVVPYYTVNAGWETLLNVTNTTGNSLVIKVRLHEARNSRDVLDFNVALSPYDVWTARISEEVTTLNGVTAPRPFLTTPDRSCTIPISVRDNGASANEIAYSGIFADNTASNFQIDRMSEGYVEILVMGEAEELTVNSTQYFAKHTAAASPLAGDPRNCATVQTHFDTNQTWDNVGNIPANGHGNPIARGGINYGPIVSEAPLKVNATLVNYAKGLAGGVESLHIARYGYGDNLVTAQVYPWFLEPTLASLGGLWNMDGLEDVERGISAQRVMNEWTDNPNTGAAAEWVVTFPTKRFYADNHNQNVQAACSKWRNLNTNNGVIADSSAAYTGLGAGSVLAGAHYSQYCPTSPFISSFNADTFQATDNGRSNILVSYDIFDREENTIVFVPDSGVTVSPAPPPPPQEIANLPYEVNVLRIGNDLNPAGASILGSRIAGPVDTSDLDNGATVGWMAMTFGANGLDTSWPNSLPVTGFLFKVRDFGDPSTNFAQATEHAYERGYERSDYPTPKAE